MPQIDVVNLIEELNKRVFNDKDDYNYVVACLADAVNKSNTPVPPISTEVYNGFGDTVEYFCFNCECGLRKNDRYKDLYCPLCGTKVDWKGIE